MSDYKSIRVAYGKSAVAYIDDGVTCVPPGGADRAYTIVDAWVRSTGNAADCTSVDISDGTTTVCVFTVAGLTNGAILRAGNAVTGVSANLLTTLAANTAISIQTVGTDIATATHIEWCVFYTVDPVYN